MHLGSNATEVTEERFGETLLTAAHGKHTVSAYAPSDILDVKLTRLERRSMLDAALQVQVLTLVHMIMWFEDKVK